MSMVLPTITHDSSINESTDLLSMQYTEPVSTIIAPTNTFPSFPLNATFTIGNPTCSMSLSFAVLFFIFFWFCLEEPPALCCRLLFVEFLLFDSANQVSDSLWCPLSADLQLSKELLLSSV